MRKIFASRETGLMVKKLAKKKLEIYSFFPNDKADCVCQKMVLEWKKKLASASTKERRSLLENKKFLECPKNKFGLSRYEIRCKKCNQVLGYCWASDSTLKDFCDFHYVQWTNGTQWYGCFTLQISPITQQLCFECACGEDTRDFRANMTLSSKLSEAHEKVNAVGREFGNKNSKFLVRQVPDNVLPFI